LLEKYAQYQEQMAQLKGRGEVEEEEMEEILTPDEKTTAEQVKKTIQKLEAGELQLDETIMSLSNYIRMA
jgi:DNA-directed RNA polymerase III subunit RPC3